MNREYYDSSERSHEAADNLSPASVPQQDGYSLLRSELTSAIERNWQDVLDSSPEIARAARSLDSYVERHGKRSFRIFRTGDSLITVDVDSTLFLR